MIRHYLCRKKEIIIDFPVYLVEVTELQNKISKEEYLDFLSLWPNNNLKEINRRLEFYKDFNLGISKHHIVIHLKNKKRKLLSLNYLTNTGISYISTISRGGSDSLDSRMKGRLGNKDELVIKYLFKNIIDNFELMLSNLIYSNYGSFGYGKYYEFSWFLKYIWISYKWGLLDKWLKEEK